MTKQNNDKVAGHSESSPPAGSSGPGLIRFCLLLIGIVFVVYGAHFHLADHFGFTKWAGAPNPFPGWEVILFTLGASIIFHSILWSVSMKEIFQKSIDYVWYSGSGLALILATISVTIQFDVQRRQTQLGTYMWYRAAALEELSALRDHCGDPTLTYQLYVEQDVVAPAPVIQPSTELCKLAETERWNWVRDEPIARYGINAYHVVPGLSETVTQMIQKAMELARWKSIPQSAQRFCDLAEAEWVKSQWGVIYEKKLRVWNKGELPSSKSMESFQGKLYHMPLPIRPPHRFGTGACATYAEIAIWVADRNRRPTWEPPKWLATLALSWPLLLGANIGFRLVKTTAEVRKAMVAATANK